MRRTFRRLYRMLSGGNPAPVILAYHRIAAAAVDPWRLAVSPAHFRAHLIYLKSHRRPMTMTEFIARLEARDLPPDAVALTFDDGYRDNLTNAKPLLIEHEVPASILIATGYVGQTGEFWWDELARLILNRREGAKSKVRLGKDWIEVKFGPITDGMAMDPWQYGDQINSARAKTYFNLWSKLRDLDSVRREVTMAMVREILGADAAPSEGGPLGESDLSKLVVANVIDIGAHSVTHPRLSKLPNKRQRREICDSKNACERLLGQSVFGFAYPHGDFDQTTKNMVREAGFHWACTTRSAFIDVERFDLLALPRIQAVNSADAKSMFGRREDIGIVR